jgi:hypothetical protein
MKSIVSTRENNDSAALAHVDNEPMIRIIVRNGIAPTLRFIYFGVTPAYIPGG